MTAWLRDLRKLHAAGKDCVRVTVMDVRGSAPREIGATMLVTAEALIGSIGGGRLEYDCTRLATHHLPGRTSVTPCSDSDFTNEVAPGTENLVESSGYRGPTRRRFVLGAGLGQCCGGVVEVLFERLPAAGGGWVGEALRCHRSRVPAVLVTSIDETGESSRCLLTAGERWGEVPAEAALSEARRLLADGGSATCLRDGDTRTLLEPFADARIELALFGAGHVGSALVNVLAGLDWRVRWVDGRRDIFPPTVPANVTCVEAGEPVREVAAMPRAAFYLVMTHSHALDFDICERILRRDDFTYCGLIGSGSKRRRFEKRFRAQGMAEDRIRKLTCPIGLPGLPGKRPAEIAVSVAAQLLKVRHSSQVRSSGEAREGNVHRLER